jgi:putative DNA primase/helicase
MVIGEGVETTLAAATRQRLDDGTLLQPAWATCGSGNLANFPVLPGIDCLTILVDHDDAGIKAAAECQHRWSSAGREVFRLKSRVKGWDFADIIAAQDNSK